MRPTNGEPKLSVVVPIYNVDRYLDECLASIAAQEVTDFEVIMVDDGSTDRSAEIAAAWADRDDHFRLVQQDNHGLGHARNTGTRHVNGQYLAFLDSDDVVPADSYRRMIEALDESGSDFATGNVHRYDSSGRSWQAPLYKGMAKTFEPATHVTRRPELLRDHLAHNKVFRTSFWRESGSEFPVGVLYEDVPTTIPAHVRAKAVDIVPVVAVLWRIRDQGDSSITQNRNSDASHIRDRVDGALTASRFVGEHAGQELKDEYDFLVLRRDLRWYVDLYPTVDEEYKTELFASIRRFMNQVSPQALRRVRVNLRPAYALIEAGAHDDFAEFVALRLTDRVNHIPVEARNGRAILDLRLPHDTAIPEYALDLTDELTVTTRVSDLTVADDELVIEGWACISQLPITDDNAQSISVWLESGEQRVPAALEYRRDARAASDIGASAEATGRAAFTARIPINHLKRRPKRRGLTWQAFVSVTNSGIQRSAPLQNPTAGRAERPIMKPLGRGQWLRVSWNNEGLSCRVRVESAVLSEVTASHDALDFSLRTSSRVKSGAQLRVRAGDEGKNFPVKGRSAVSRRGSSRVRVADLPGLIRNDGVADPASVTSWDVLFKASKSSSWQRLQDPVGQRDDVVALGDAELAVRRSRGATVGITLGPCTPVLTSAQWLDDGTLNLTLTASEPPVDAIVLKARLRKEQVAFPTIVAGRTLTTRLPVFALQRFGDTLPLRAGTWDIVAKVGDDLVRVRIGSDVIDDLPTEATVSGRRATLTDSKRESVCLTVDGDLSPTERGTANQERLRKTVYPSLKTTIHDAVLYETYYGKEFSESPREVFNELQARGVRLEHLVVVRDQQVIVPDGAVAVPYRSERYYEALAQSRFIVANTHLPACHAKAEGQTVLQTWHGLGTKKVGLDMDAVHFANKSYIDNIRGGETDNWDYLVSPNPFTSPILRRAFAYKGTLLETGVPRNDIFRRPDRDERAKAVKERLGIDAGKKVVLYAPTWRDNAFDGPGRYRLDLRFDVHEAAKSLGDDYALVFRKHSNVVDRLPRGNGLVVDASDYPEVQELLLITDVLISDYSTLMCDFANTGRPMLFYTYDLANYRDVLRGFYFDFENEVPGPLIMNEDDLVPAIADADRIRSDFDAKYRAFAERFCPWDDGHATGRVVDAVFGEFAS
jgi:CDP-glycerol glycerophosphotransferase